MKHTAQNMLHKIFNKTFKNLQLKVKTSSPFQVHSVKGNLSETREVLYCTIMSVKNFSYYLIFGLIFASRSLQSSF